MTRVPLKVDDDEVQGLPRDGGRNVIGVIMTGMAYDGAKGMR